MNVRILDAFVEVCITFRLLVSAVTGCRQAAYRSAASDINHASNSHTDTAKWGRECHYYLYFSIIICCSSGVAAA